MFFVSIFCGLIFSKCTKNSTKTNEVVIEKRIKMIERSGVNVHYQIIEIDGHQYVSTSNGGILHLESCKCKSTK